MYKNNNNNNKKKKDKNKRKRTRTRRRKEEEEDEEEKKKKKSHHQYHHYYHKHHSGYKHTQTKKEVEGHFHLAGCRQVHTADTRWWGGLIASSEWGGLEMKRLEWGKKHPCTSALRNRGRKVAEQRAAPTEIKTVCLCVGQRTQQPHQGISAGQTSCLKTTICPWWNSNERANSFGGAPAN